MKCARRKFLKAGLLFVPSVALSQSVIYSPVYDPPTIDWANRVRLNGGAPPSANTLGGLTAFSRRIRNLRSRIYNLNVVAPDSIIAFRTPFIVGLGLDPWVRHTIGGPGADADILDNTGWKGFTNILNGYVYDTGIKPSQIASFGAGNAGMALYTENPNANGNFAAGCYTAGTIDPQFGIVPWQDGGGNASYFYSYTTPRVINVVISTTQPGHSGFYLGSLSSTTRADFYFANSSTAWSSVGNNTSTHTEAAPSDSSISVGGSHQGSTYNLLNSPISFYCLCDGFSSAEGQSLFNAVQALRTNFGSGFA